MCGRYAAAKDTATLVDEFQVEQVIDPVPAPNYNVAPTTSVAMVVDRPVDDVVHRQLRLARWGLIPSWAKDRSIGARMINARWEEAAAKPAFRAAFAKRRCLVPADGYFEWYTPTATEPRSGRVRKQPYYVHRSDGATLGLAGLYEFWRPGPDDPWLVSLSVLTTASAGPLAPLHARMPVVIEPAGYARWLDPASAVDRGFSQLLPVEALVAHPVSTAVNAVGNNGPHLIEPIPAEPEFVLPPTGGHER